MEIRKYSIRIQGTQFTSKEFTQKLLNNRIRISMDGRGRVFDNIFIERLWRTVKYDNIYVQGYETITDVRQGLKTYFARYNTERLHQSLDYQTPWEVYSGIKFNVSENKMFHLKLSTLVLTSGVLYLYFSFSLPYKITGFGVMGYSFLPSFCRTYNYNLLIVYSIKPTGFLICCYCR